MDISQLSQLMAQQPPAQPEQHPPPSAEKPPSRSQRRRSRSRSRPRQTHEPDEHMALTLGMAPFRAVRNSVRFLTSVPGFGVVATLASCYCFALSVAAIFVATPRAVYWESYTAAMQAERRFVPKPYVNDGAELGRLNPLPTLQRAVLSRYFQWLPLWIRGNVATPYYTVWDSPGVLVLSVLVAIIIQRFESILWRKRSREETLTEFYEANAVKQVTADPKAIVLAELKAREHNAQGLGSVVGTFLAMSVLYGLEIIAFFGSFTGAGHWLANTIYGFLTICGYEAFDRMTD